MTFPRASTFAASTGSCGCGDTGPARTMSGDPRTALCLQFDEGLTRIGPAVCRIARLPRQTGGARNAAMQYLQTAHCFQRNEETGHEMDFLAGRAADAAAS